ncbi:uncharacterized protein [Palaemon carinicauda]|uniref:uncharacterized protein n=1 Tax=Palaemon carinicauda TaxID=392227 RepID=UPI0035B5A32B
MVCAYAPQTVCTQEEKDTFWEEMDQKLKIILTGEREIIAGDLNCPFDISREGIEKVHGGWDVYEGHNGVEKIKWWKLKEDELRVLFKERVLEVVRLYEDVQEWLTKKSNVILRIGEEVLGKSSGRRPPNDKKLWWWNGEVQERVKTKKEAKKKADLSGQEQDKANYKQANKGPKRAVAKAKAELLNEVYKEMEKSEEERKIL